MKTLKLRINHRLASTLATNFLVVVFALMQPDAAQAKDTDCVKKRGDVQIKACTRIIKTKRYLGKRVNNKQLSVFRVTRGLAYFQKGQYDRAIADYDKAIKLNPKYALAYFSRGFIYFIKGQHSKAIADYDKAIKLNPKYALAYFSRGNLYNKEAQYDRAIADYDNAIQLNPKLAHAYSRRGLAYFRKGQYDRAIADYRKTLQIDPSHSSARDKLKALGAKP